MDLSRIGSDGVVFVVAGALLALLWRKPWFLAVLITADLAADGLSLLLRQWIGRARPPSVYREPEPLVSVPHTGAFPSGHASTAFACATVITWASRRLAAPAFVLAAAIAWSRVYVGVHWPLDVLGGALLGVFIGTFLVFLARRSQGREATALRTPLRALRRSRRAPPGG